MQTAHLKQYFISVTSVSVFNSLVQAAETTAARQGVPFETRRSRGYYELLTTSRSLWHELYLYGQVLAQAQDENIEGGELIA